MSKLRNNSLIQKLGVQRLVIFGVLVILFAFFCIMSPSFRKYSTIITMASYMYYIMLMAIGVTFPLITGGVDLSIGTGLVCYSIVGSLPDAADGPAHLVRDAGDRGHGRVLRLLQRHHRRQAEPSALHHHALHHDDRARAGLHPHRRHDGRLADGRAGRELVSRSAQVQDRRYDLPGGAC